MAAAVAPSTSDPALAGRGAGRSTVDAAADAAASAVEASLTRVCWQRIELGAAAGGHRGRALVMGIRHRRPVTVVVSLEVAAVLRQRGLRTVIRRVGA